MPPWQLQRPWGHLLSVRSSSREIEAMRAIPYAQVGFYDDQTGAIPSYQLTTVSLGATSPSTGPLAPRLDPQTSSIVQGSVSYSGPKSWEIGLHTFTSSHR